MECEICGRKEAVCLVYLEGAKMNSCAGCSRGGKVLYFFSSEAGDSDSPLAPSRPTRTEEEIVDGYGKLIKEARIKAGISIEELGMKIAEKSNYLDHIERQTSLPSVALARKLEKFLKIRLVEMETTQTGEGKGGYGKKELTLLDVAEIERKEDKKGKK